MPGRVQTVRAGDSNSIAPSTPNPHLTITTGVMTILLPAVFVFSLIAQRRRSQKLMQQRIAQLERSWQLKSPGNSLP